MWAHQNPKWDPKWDPKWNPNGLRIGTPNGTWAGQPWVTEDQTQGWLKFRKITLFEFSSPMSLRGRLKAGRNFKKMHFSDFQALGD